MIPLGRLLLLLLLVAAGASEPAAGQQPVPQVNQPAVAPQKSVPASWSTKARQVDDLIAGRLDVTVDPAALFDVSLDGPDAARTQAVLKLASDPRFYAAARRDPAILAPLPADQAAFALAQASFLRLSEKRRAELIAIQHRRSEQAQRQERTLEAKRKNLADLKSELGGLKAFLAGKPAPGDLPQLNLLRLRALATMDQGTRTKSGMTEPPADAPLDQRIAWTRAQLAEATDKLLALPPDQLKQLANTAAAAVASQAPLDQAEAALQSAKLQLSDAQRVSTSVSAEQERLIAAEQTKLVTVTAAQTRVHAQLAALKAEPLSIADRALGWRRRVQEVEAVNLGQAAQADQLYGELVKDLKQVRQALRSSLDRSERLGSVGIDPPQLDAALPQGLAVTARLRDQRRALLGSAAELRRNYAVTLWKQRRALRDAMVSINGERLSLIPLLSPAKRNAVLGFGQEGIAQVQREVSQIILDLRFHLQGWRNFLASTSDLFLRPTPALVLGLLRLVLIALLFRWWRQAGGDVLARTQQALEAKRPRTLLSTMQATIIGHVRNVRRSLDWLVFAIVMRWLMPDELRFAGLDLAWIILFWSLSAILFVRLVDDLARSGASEDLRARLRWNSLRLIAGSLLGVGLVLALTSASVGKGAIYSWVLAICWLLVPAIILLLAHWWRERIVALAASASGNSALLTWVARDPGGLLGLVGRVTAGAALLLAGAQTVIARRAGDLALVREIFEQRRRSQAARQVAEDKASGRFHRLPPEILDVLDPHRLPAQPRLDDTRPGGLVLPEIAPAMITAIIGERGLGKSAVLRDLSAQVDGDGQAIALRVDPRGLDGLLADLATALQLSPADRSPETLARALAGRDAPTLIAIDDVQRLAVPAIGGLAMLDSLIALARQCERPCSWVLAIGGPAWSYISRARVDRALFDMIIHLPRWSADELRAMVERRTEQAGIEPDFSGLVDEGAFRFEGELTPAERRRRGYFERLADYAHGNPAIALEYWRRSLFVDDASGRVTVRTFATPDVTRLVAMPMPSMFVLRAIMQMDMADSGEIVRSTDLPVDIVVDALRGLERLGTIASTNGSYRITLFWWTEAIRLLERQNLIVRDAT